MTQYATSNMNTVSIGYRDVRSYGSRFSEPESWTLVPLIRVCLGMNESNDLHGPELLPSRLWQTLVDTFRADLELRGIEESSINYQSNQYYICSREQDLLLLPINNAIVGPFIPTNW